MDAYLEEGDFLLVLEIIHIGVSLKGQHTKSPLNKILCLLNCMPDK